MTIFWRVRKQEIIRGKYCLLINIYYYILFQFQQQFLIRVKMTNLQLTGHSSQILTVRYNNPSTLLASSGMDKQILLWYCPSSSSSQSYSNILSLKSHTNAVTSLFWSHTDNLVSGSADKTVCNWDIQIGKVIRKYRGNGGIVQAVSCPRKVKFYIGSAGDDGTVRIWDNRSKEEIKVHQTKYPITSLAFSLNGEKIFFGGIDNDIHCYNLTADKIQQKIQCHQDTICSLQLSHDGSYLLSNSFDETLRIWDIRPTSSSNPQKKLQKTFSGHSQGTDKTLLRACWSIDGLYVACGSIDKCVYIWDTATRQIVQKLGGHLGTVTQVSMGKDNYIASGSNDRTVIVTKLDQVML